MQRKSSGWKQAGILSLTAVLLLGQSAGPPISGVSGIAVSEALVTEDDQKAARGKQAMGDNFFAQQRYTEAEAYYRAALALDGSLYDAELGLAKVYVEQKKYDDAEALLKRIYQENPRNLSAIETLAGLYLNSGRLDEALAEYRKGFAWGGGARFQAGAAKILDSQGRTEEAIAALQQGIAAEPQVSDSYQVLGQIYLRRGEYQRAEKLYLDGIQYLKSDSSLYKGLSQVYRALNDYEKATFQLTESLSRHNQDSEAYLMLGDLYSDQGKADMAESQYRQALRWAEDPVVTLGQDRVELAPVKRAELIFKIAQALSGQKQWELAIEADQKALEFDKTRSDIKVHLGQAYAADGQGTEAEKAFAEALAMDPGQPDVLLAAGRYYLGGKRYEAARPLLSQVVQADGRNVEALIALGDTYAGSQRYWQAEDFYRQALALAPKNIVALNRLGAVLRDSGRYEEGLQVFFRLKDLDTAHADAYVGLGDCYYLNGRPAEARSYYEQAFSLDQSDPRVHMGLGYLLLGEGNEGEAKRKFAYAQRLSPSTESLLTKNKAPQGKIEVRPDGGPAPLKVLLDGGVSTDPDGTIVQYDWYLIPGGGQEIAADFTALDGSARAQHLGTGKTLEWLFPSPGQYRLILMVTDDQGAQTRVVHPVAITGGISLRYNGQTVTVDPSAGKIRLESGRVLVPMRLAFELFGATVDYDPATKLITGRLGTREVKLTADSATAWVNGQEQLLDVPARIDEASGRTMIPLRFVAEALGAQVVYSPDTQVVDINR
ncbi:tetratricopeptide repeat protein [Heliobacillus mobilis]|uniref:Tetratricopeptide repeat protein n=1 Tax=Heliobacterium mobile TaxID=28064 RepID=A0A6I3SLT2_HELMO|nr:tetratricopeptide repeat protein [Heliobacterium mobile]MTV49904.1 tetratricopeptide repeat protein [Heliobacterium mobile]